MVDSKSGVESNLRYIWSFIRDVISNLQLREDLINVRFVQQCASVPEFHQNSYQGNKTGLLRELNARIATPRKTAELFRSVAEAVSGQPSPDKRRQVAVYITDGSSPDVEETVDAAREVKEKHGVELYGVGVGGRINPIELKQMVRGQSNQRSRLYMMSHHVKLPKVSRHLANELCWRKFKICRLVHLHIINYYHLHIIYILHIINQ